MTYPFMKEEIATMDEVRAELQAERDAEEKWIAEQTCERCGNETSNVHLRDESGRKCGTCGHIDMK